MSLPPLPAWLRPLGVPLQVVAWVLALLLPFIVPPPTAWMDAPSNDVWVPLLHVILVVTVGALLVIAARRKSPRPAAWLAASVAALLAGVALFGAYLVAHSVWACAYARLPSGAMTYTVLGSTPIASAPAAAQEALAAGVECTTVVRNLAGMTDRLWDRTELLYRQMVLAALFTASSAVFAVAIVSLVEALRRTPARARGPGGSRP